METIVQEEKPQMRPPVQLNGPAPDFEADTTQGRLRFHEWKRGKWAILFAHPADFTPVCTTEFIGFARHYEELQRRNVLLLGNSVDSTFSHIAWIRNIKERFDVDIPYPVVADLDQKVSRLYGMVHETASVTAAVRAVYFIDPDNRVRAIIYYPMNVGRNMDEIVRVVDALQTADRNGVSCPADWRPGEDVIVSPPATARGAEERMKDKSLKVTEWYFSKRSL